jgi:hypothetical protein
LINLDSRLVQSQTSIATDISNPFIVGHQRLYTLNASVFLMYVNVWQISPISRLIAGKKRKLGWRWTSTVPLGTGRLRLVLVAVSGLEPLGHACCDREWSLAAPSVSLAQASEDARVFSLGLVPWMVANALFYQGFGLVRSQLS